nr:protoporphyrinogen oxidase-like [Biomphalaria glabrata]
MASQAAAQQLGIKSHPIRSHVILQKECLPQYKAGHVSWVEKVEQKIKESNLPLHLVGSSYRGPAINDCIYNAKKVVESLKAHLIAFTCTSSYILSARSEIINNWRKLKISNCRTLQ